MSNANPDCALILPADALRQHWQGHRRLTRRVIAAFPDDQLFTFTMIDNEIHHRGQGYVYLRALGIEPPPFYERG
jgi:uncharacterized damage-inducible protein DinB